MSLYEQAFTKNPQETERVYGKLKPCPFLGKQLFDLIEMEILIMCTAPHVKQVHITSLLVQLLTL